MGKPLFTPEELAEMARYDAEIEDSFALTLDEIAAAKAHDLIAKNERRSTAERKIAAYQKAYYEANKEEIAAYQKAYYEANKEEIAACQKAYYQRKKQKEKEIAEAHEQLEGMV